MSDTLSSIRSEITLYLRGDLKGEADQQVINAEINNSIESIWTPMMRAQLSRFMGIDSPVTLNVPSGTERMQLVSIPDPTVAPLATTFVSGALGARTYLLGFTYVTESGSETQLSPTVSLSVPINSLAQVSAPPAVANAYGWNLYVSATNTSFLMALQNQQPLQVAQPYQENQVGWQDFPIASQGAPVAQSSTSITIQPPSENTTADNIAWISHMEVRTSDTLLRTWHQYDVNSDIMTRYGRELSSASEYQTYVWDLINGNRFEIRPTTGLAFNPRYFYVAKPRRLLYDQATIPYQNISGVHEFIIYKSLASLKLILEEYLASQGWDAKAAAAKKEVIDGLLAESWAQNDRIAPHLF